MMELSVRTIHLHDSCSLFPWSMVRSHLEFDFRLELGESLVPPNSRRKSRQGWSHQNDQDTA